MMISIRRVILSVLALPFVVLVVIPVVILYKERVYVYPEHSFTPEITFLSVISLILLLTGSLMFIATNRLFVTEGHGTLAPWDPPEHLVIEGIYRYVRNPMIIGVCLMLLAETLFFRSCGIAFWVLVFFTANPIYFPLKEEKDLVIRFGEDYEEYRRNVPAWLPRLTPWRKSNES